jgi:hypothetical protein
MSTKLLLKSKYGKKMILKSYVEKQNKKSFFHYIKNIFNVKRKDQ